MKPNKLSSQRFKIIDDMPGSSLQGLPEWIQKFNRDQLSIEETDWITFINDLIPNGTETTKWKAFNEDAENREYAIQLLDFLTEARSDTFIRVVYYREWFKERVWYLALIYNKEVLKRLENPTFEDQFILNYFYE